MLQNRVSELERENDELKASRDDGNRWEGERRQLEQVRCSSHASSAPVVSSGRS